MSFVTWILLGLVAGLLGSKIINRHGEGVVIDVMLGVAGAMAGGYLLRWLGLGDVTGFNVWSLLVPITGSVLLLVAYHAAQRARSPSR